MPLQRVTYIPYFRPFRSPTAVTLTNYMARYFDVVSREFGETRPFEGLG